MDQESHIFWDLFLYGHRYLHYCTLNEIKQQSLTCLRIWLELQLDSFTEDLRNEKVFSTKVSLEKSG